jgi:hypothetical protein
MTSRNPGVRTAAIVALSWSVLATGGAFRSAAAQAPAAALHAITWSDDRAAVERCLRESPIERFEDIPIGVTKPKRAYFKAGDVVRSAAWKPLMPGRYKGFWESYKSEIAAYELDKVLGLDMVPPTVERRINGSLGAIVMWVDGVKGWDIKQSISPPDAQAWSLQVIRMKMLDQLIGNIDRNQGNLLYDGDYHLVLIDHSRAFTTSSNISRISPPTRIDAALWAKMQALALPDLQAALGKWIGKGEISALLKRRDRMQQQIDRLLKDRGEAAVFVR